MAYSDSTWTINDCLDGVALLPRDEYAIKEDGPLVTLSCWYVACDVQDGDRTIRGAAVSQHLSSMDKAEMALAILTERYHDAHITEVARQFNRLHGPDAERMKWMTHGIG